MKKTIEEKVSIIVPVYKVEKYLSKCIESIINQSYSNLEIILVDDGSPDNCGEICDEYAKKDNRIKVIHKENGGLSDARNKGLEKATGEYIAFIDSDDYISNDYIEYLLNLIKKHNGTVSIIMPFEVYEVNNKKMKQPKEKIEIYNNINALKTMLYQKKFDNSAWGKMYSKEIVKGIKFPVGKLYEDIGTVYKYILKSDKIIYSNQMKYYYLQRNDSIMGATYKKKDKDYVYQAENMMNDLKKIKNRDIEKASICRYVNANFSILIKIKKDKNFIDDRQELLDNIKKYRAEVLLNIHCRIKTKIAILFSYLGIF